MSIVSNDKYLIGQCLAGREEAWTELYGRCQPVLLGQIRSWLGSWKQCGELAEEVAARVWLKLVENGHARLAKFDPAQGTKLTTFLVAIGRREFLMLLRERTRRLARETARASNQPISVTDDRLELDLAEYLEQLNAAEKLAVSEHLGDELPPVELEQTIARNRLNRRLIKKLQSYLSPTMRADCAPSRTPVAAENCENGEKNLADGSGGGI